MTPTLINADTPGLSLNWPDAVEALRKGHLRPRAEIADLFLGPPTGTLLNRAAFIDGLGYGVKAVTVMDGNADKGLPTVQGTMMLFDAGTGTPKAMIDSRLVTAYKTAADSVLGACLLARPDSRHLLIVGAGVVARSLVSAYRALFPELDRISIWARRLPQAEALVDELSIKDIEVRAVSDLERASGEADIVSCATMAREPILKGDWISPGTHVDLIGAFKADMREADDRLITTGSLFVDSRDTTIHHIGELAIPIAAGVLREADVRGDFYDLVPGQGKARQSADEVTLFKNGGGAHLDLMIADWIAGQSAGR